MTCENLALFDSQRLSNCSPRRAGAEPVAIVCIGRFQRRRCAEFALLSVTRSFEGVGGP